MKRFYYENCEIKTHILGSEWTVRIADRRNAKLFDDAQCDGFCDATSRMIVIASYDPNDKAMDPQNCMQNIIAHEIVHAFLYESGLSDNFEHVHRWGHEETMVDWIALQMDKIVHTKADIYTKLIDHLKIVEEDAE